MRDIGTHTPGHLSKCHSDPERSEGEESRAFIPFTPCHPSASLRASPFNYAQGRPAEGYSTARNLCRMNLFDFGSLTGVSGSASAERRLQPQKGYNPSPGSFTHFFYFCPATEFRPGYRAFSQFRPFGSPSTILRTSSGQGSGQVSGQAPALTDGR